MLKSIILHILAIAFAATAAYLSYTLLQLHVNAKPPEWFDFGCSVQPEKGTPNCKAVVQTRWGYFPPLNAEGKRWFRWTVPAAQLGWAYYSAILIWLVCVGGASYERRWVHGLFLAATGLGLAGSVYFMVMMFSRLDHWCPWCIVTHALNLGVFVCAVLLRPRKPVETLREPSRATTPRAALPRATAPALPAPRPNAPHPTLRGLAATVLAMAFVSSAENYMLGKALTEAMAATNQQTLGQCMEGLNQLRGDPNRLFALWEQAEKRTTPVRPDDPIKTGAKPGQPAWDLVIFSDFECPSCKRTAAMVDQDIFKLFDGGIRVIYKHFPANLDCNTQMAQTVHKNACTATRIAEAARLLAGPEGFWKAHDLLFAMQKNSSTNGLDGLDPAAVAAQLGLDSKKLIGEMNSPIIAQRIAEDAAEAVKAGIPSTPYLILAGRPINGLAAKEIPFWDKLADRYWQEAGVPRPEATKIKAVPATTPGTPGPTGGW